ncbi:MAG: hypothetical protein KF841_15990 [Phycisphaerae bacterium]|nr:hypothetical protein [Phycisphaerae bacterium]
MVMHFRMYRLIGVLLVAAASLAHAADVNLEFRPLSQSAAIGEIVLVPLYAVSAEPGVNQTISALDVIIQWDPAILVLLGVQNNGPYPWLQSTFFSDANQDGLNNTWLDGNAFYTALANFSTSALATPAGLHVTTFRFQVIGEGTSPVSILASFPQSTHTVVFGGDFVGQRVTGSLGSASVSVSACASAPDGDMNSNGLADGEDIEFFVPAVLGSSTAAEDVCPGDFNGNGVMDIGDVNGMVSALLGVS